MTQNIKIFSLLLIATILSMSLISALTIVSPANGASVSGTYILNVSAPANEQLTNCSVYAKSSSTANSTWTLLVANAKMFNSTGVINANGTFASTILEDSTDYQFNFTCKNYSNVVSDVLSTASIKIDNTVPTAPSALSPTSDTDGNVDFSATVTSRETTACTLYFPTANPGATSYPMTYSGSSCTTTINSIAEQIYDYYIQASDGTNTTNSASTVLTVKTSSGGGISGGSNTARSVSSSSELSQTQLGDSISSGVTIGSKISEVWNNIVNFFKGLFNK